MILSRRTLLAALAASSLAASCTLSAEMPQLQARNMTFTGSDASGLTFQCDFIAFNTNGFALDLENLHANLIIEGNDVGAGVAALSAQLPPGRWTPVSATVTVPWNGVPAFLLAAAASPTVNYTMRGEVTVHRFITVHPRFETSGTIPRDLFLRGAANTINGLLNQVVPGLGVQVGP